jgi:D-xylose 1-dehydrogenase
MADFAKYPSLRGRTILVSGGASGIGASIVEHFVEQGSKVAFLDIDEAAGKAHADAMAKKGEAPLFLPCDLRDIPALERAAQQVIAKLGPVTALVNNAARDDRHKIEDVTTEYWDERMNVNLRHAFFLSKAVIPGMREKGGGSIVNFSSVSYHVKTPDLSVYQTAKAGVVGLTRAFARDLGADAIRVNAIVPGWIMTERQISLWLTPEGEKDLMKAQCLKEKVYPPDIARMVLFLAADDSRLITGQSFVVDGGRI